LLNFLQTYKEFYISEKKQANKYFFIVHSTKKICAKARYLHYFSTDLPKGILSQE